MSKSLIISHLFVRPDVPCQEAVNGALPDIALAVYWMAGAERHQRLARGHRNADLQLSDVVGEVSQVLTF